MRLAVLQLYFLICWKSPVFLRHCAQKNNYRAMQQFEQEVARREANGRFVRKVDEPWKNIPETDDASTVMHSRFSLGSIGRR